VVKLFGFSLFVFILGAWANVAYEGGSGFAQSSLASSLTASATSSIAVTDASQFYAQDLLYVDDEVIRYTARVGNTFTGITRGFANTTPATHSSGTIARSSDNNAMNVLTGYRARTLDQEIGATDIVVLGYRFVTHGIPKIIMWDFGVFETSYGQYLWWVFFMVSAMLVIATVSLLLSLVSGVIFRT